MIKIFIQHSMRYAAFLDEPTYFNLISNIKAKNWISIPTVGIIFVVLSSEGILQEIEIVPAGTTPYSPESMYTCKTTYEGMPIFDPLTLNKAFTRDPEIFFEESSKKAFLLFNERKNEINTAYVYQNLKFLCAGDELVALEIEQVVRDNDNKQQSVWEYAHGLCKDEDDNT